METPDTYLRPPNYILKLLKDSDFKSPQILIMRHAAREETGNTPIERIHELTLIDAGREQSLIFGHELAQISAGKAKTIYFGHTRAGRSGETARLIQKGFEEEEKESPHKIPTKYMGIINNFHDPLINCKLCDAEMKKCSWTDLFIGWCRGTITKGILEDQEIYCKEVFKTLIDFNAPNKLKAGELLVAVSHDTVVIPILSKIFNKEIVVIEFLNGVLVTLKDNNLADVEYCNCSETMKKSL